MTQEMHGPGKEEDTVVTTNVQREASEIASDKAGRNVPHSGCNTGATANNEDSPGSPSILEIILEGDTTLPADHDMSQSPTVQSQHMEIPPPGVKPPTFAEMAHRGANKKPSVSILLHCAVCGLKFYTQKGRSDHSTECKETATTVGQIETEAEKLPTKSKCTETTGSKKKAEKTKKGQRSWKRKPVRPVYCKYCDLNIFLLTTLEDHYLR
ncbi:hypothetical protein TNCV_4268321 [Trichonephila clavipes]|nr:hypothetical protein TNCV_4268321 [Trichonephila clavipes]